MTTKVLPCSCKNEFQDLYYGKGQRLHNFAPKANNTQGGWRCTVCENVKQVSKSEQEAKKKKGKKNDG